MFKPDLTRTAEILAYPLEHLPGMRRLRAEVLHRDLGRGCWLIDRHLYGHYERECDFQRDEVNLAIDDLIEAGLAQCVSGSGNLAFLECREEADHGNSP